MRLRHNWLQFPRSFLLWKLEFPAEGTSVSTAGNRSVFAKKQKWDYFTNYTTLHIRRNTLLEPLPTPWQERQYIVVRQVIKVILLYVLDSNFSGRDRRSSVYTSLSFSLMCLGSLLAGKLYFPEHVLKRSGVDRLLLSGSSLLHTYQNHRVLLSNRTILSWL